MADTEKPKFGFAGFRSDILWMLQPIVQHSRRPENERYFDTIVVEPCAEGGAIVAAVSAHAMAVFRDPDGTCSAPMTLGIPDDMFKACQPPEPIHMGYCGGQYFCPLPEWAQPSIVYAYSVGAHVVPKMRHPDWAEEDDEFHPALYSTMECGKSYHIGRDYKWTDGTPVNWRGPLERALASPLQTSGFSIVHPDVQALFTRIPNRIAEVRQKAASVFHRHSQSATGEPLPTIVTVDDYPDFVGVYMTQNPLPYQPPALWFQKRVGERIGGIQ
ncbi:hypothetical protein [Phyllobacterium chamaecytisi]|uniref:hypothetical protein n=1 Tax=Phyllobacterium chamaecytisi TaxID=2876082 RepID=UPI001CCBA939|nr:hypothetical protein [Phyllobacterium sp. KW56]MBZ9600693.1 hypothetical protein [Phyllobacterium sp. KW56]